MIPVYVFRPNKPYVPTLRYADGKWLPDNGQPDLAFIDDRDAPFALYVEIPNYDGILWSWVTKEHGWLWHYYVKDSQIGWGNRIPDKIRDQHPNRIACKSAMDYLCKGHGCANGRDSNPHNAEDFGDIWIKDTMEKVLPPRAPICYLCMDNNRGHRIQKSLEAVRKTRSELDYSVDDYVKTEARLYDLEHEIKSNRESLHDKALALKEIVHEQGLPVGAILN